ncbi:DUF389 domain-containing protein [Capnocytophaga canimorsus]|uniref:DUF389 domain-containing protein n=1 Tax=Capnocytophaga canimorsus TaxID=28188 RepID=UPI001ACE3EA6|nr:DUF389 domain-containing protein [Capnocytophaga canimorsus]GIM59279.1 membrane protein [Capnocytophaga canimorsus]
MDNTPENKQPEEDQINLFQWIKEYIRDFVDIRKETDQQATIESIKSDIAFRGHTAWILVCSIFVASIGLNANSTAVVIGAMLISPLMGPILGIALSLAMNDVDLLRRAIKNFSVMVMLSIFAAFLFFWLFPLRDASSELLARTTPDIRDVLIAFFGGLALIIARTKKGTVASVIFGVAIATALMPPLCTVGFGLAIGNLSFAMGALYLFIINAIFIALATFLILRVIRVPMVHYANSSKRKRISNIAYILSTLVMIPAGYTFWQVLKKSQFDNSARQFITENIVPYKFANNNGRFVNELSNFKYNDGNSFIELVFIGDEAIPENVIETWNSQKEKYKMLKNSELRIIDNSKGGDQGIYVKELYETNKEDLKNSKSKIAILESEVKKMSKFNREALLFENVTKEAAVNYENLRRITFSNELISNLKSIDTLPVFRVTWKDGLDAKQSEAETKKLQKWLQLKFGNNKIVVKEQ